MTIEREAVDRGAVDFSDIASGRRLPAVHPGRFVRDEFLVPLGLSVYALAKALNVPRPRLNDVVRGRARRQRGHGASPRTLLRNFAAILGEPPSPLRSRHRRARVALHDRPGSQAPRRLNRWLAARFVLAFRGANPPSGRASVGCT